MAKKKKLKNQKAVDRPSYKTLKEELKALEESLTQIRQDEADSKGPLDEVALAQADEALKALGAAKALFTCVQDHAPYRGRP